MKVDITSAAEADLEGIADYIAHDSPVRALSFVRELYERCLDIAGTPEAWPIVPRYEHHRIRRRVHGRYLIFYCVSVDCITIRHIPNGAMDVEAILFPDLSLRDMTCLSRGAVHNALEEPERRGWITGGYGKVEVIAPHALDRFVAEISRPRLVPRTVDLGAES